MTPAPDTGRTADLYAKLMAKREEAAGFADEHADASKGPAGSVEREHRARAGAFAEAAEMAKVADAEIARLRAQIAVMKRERRHADNRIIAQRWNLRQLEARFSAPGSPAYAKLFQFAQRKAAEVREVRSLLNNASSEVDISMPNDRSPPLQDLPEELVTAIEALSVAAEEFGGQTWIAAGDGAAVIRAQATLTAAILSRLREADAGRKAAEAEAAHLRAENANLRDRVREAEKGAEAMRWRRTGSRMNLLENARPEVQWFRPSDGLVQMFPDGFDPNSGTYGPVVIVGGHPIFLCPGETLLPATEPQEAGE